MTAYAPPPYRAEHRVPAWLIRIDRYLPLRAFRWHRRRVGGTWVRLWAHLLPAGGCEYWHSETLDATVGMHCMLMKREVYDAR